MSICRNINLHFISFFMKIWKRCLNWQTCPQHENVTRLAGFLCVQGSSNIACTSTFPQPVPSSSIDFCGYIFPMIVTVYYWPNVFYFLFLMRKCSGWYSTQIMFSSAAEMLGHIWTLHNHPLIFCHLSSVFQAEHCLESYKSKGSYIKKNVFYIILFCSSQ